MWQGQATNGRQHHHHFLFSWTTSASTAVHTHTCCWFIHLFVCTHSAAAARTRTMGHNRKSTDKKKKKKKLISFACHRPPLLLFTNVCRIIIIDAWRVVEIAGALPPFVVWTQTKEKKNCPADFLFPFSYFFLWYYLTQVITIIIDRQRTAWQGRSVWASTQEAKEAYDMRQRLTKRRGRQPMDSTRRIASSSSMRPTAAAPNCCRFSCWFIDATKRTVGGSSSSPWWWSLEDVDRHLKIDTFCSPRSCSHFEFTTNWGKKKKKNSESEGVVFVVAADSLAAGRKRTIHTHT